MNDQPTLDLPEFDAPAWEPVWEKSIDDFGWQWPVKGSIPLHEDGTPITAAEWDTYLSSHRCRDCGGEIRKLKSTHGCGGASGDGMYSLCDDCAGLDGCCTREHDRGTNWHVSNWGVSHRTVEHDQLTAVQTARRTRYLVEVSS